MEARAAEHLRSAHSGWRAGNFGAKLVGVPGHSARSSRAVWLQSLDVASVVGFGLLWIALAARLGAAASPSQLLVSVALALPVGYLAADLASGAIHWLADSFFEERAPLIGPLLIEPFRDHHRNPEDITQHGFFEITGNNCLVTIPLLGALWFWGSATGPLSAFVLAVALSGALGVFATNLIHSWAHCREDDLPDSVMWLQRSGLILSIEHHARHHAGANDRAYCVTSGWLNPLLDRFEVFARLEGWIRGWRPGGHA